MEISTGKDQEIAKASVMEELAAIKDKNSREYRDKVRELELSLGIKEVNSFGTANRAIFEENLDAMSLIEIQSFARRLKLDTSGQKASVKTRLLRAFDTQNSQSRGYFSPQPQNKEMFTQEQKEKLQKILNG
jgi:hypothetical protein